MSQRGRGRILEQEEGTTLARARAGVRGRGVRVRGGRSQMIESDTRSQIQRMRVEMEQLTRSISSSTNHAIQSLSNRTSSFLTSSTTQSNSSSQPGTSSSCLFSPVATAKEISAAAKATATAAKVTAAAKATVAAQVGFFVNLGRDNIIECASAYFHAAFHVDENVSPYVTWKGMPHKNLRSMEQSRFTAACREAMRLNPKFPGPIESDFRVAMEKALKALENRRRRRHAPPVPRRGNDDAPPEQHQAAIWIEEAIHEEPRDLENAEMDTMENEENFIEDL